MNDRDETFFVSDQWCHSSMATSQEWGGGKEGGKESEEGRKKGSVRKGRGRRKENKHPACMQCRVTMTTIP